MVEPDYVESFVYNIGYPQQVHFFDPALVTHDGAYCSDIEFEVKMSDSSDINASIFI